MGSTPTTPLLPPPTSSKTRWYPTPDKSLSPQSQIAIRRAFDNIYQIDDALLPIGVQAFGTSSVVIPAAVTNPPASIPGCSVVFPRAGLWQVTGVFAIQVLDAGDLALPIYGSILVQGLQVASGQSVAPVTNLLQRAVIQVQAQPEFHMISQAWSFRVNAKGNARLQVVKDTTATGTHTLVDGLNSSILAVWCGL